MEIGTGEVAILSAAVVIGVSGCVALLRRRDEMGEITSLLAASKETANKIPALQLPEVRRGASQAASRTWLRRTSLRIVSAAVAALVRVLAFGTSHWLAWTALGVAVGIGPGGARFLFLCLRHLL